MDKKRFPLVADPEFIKFLKVEAAKNGETMTDFIIAAVKERVERINKGDVRK